MRLALIIASVVAATSPARADDELADARRLEAALDYQGALAIVDRAIAHGGADPGRLAELHLLAGKLAAGLDRAQLAEDHFARALALRPDATLVDGTSPKLTAPFAAARARTATLQVTITAVHGLITLTPEVDALGLIVGIQVHVVDAAGQHRDLVDRHGTRLAVPAGTTAIEAAALDANGNRVWVGGVPAERIAPPPASTAERSRLARWSSWAVIGGGSLAIGGFAAWRFSVAQHDWDQLRSTGEYTQLRALEATGRRWGTTANIAFGVGAATGITALILYLRQGEEPRVIVGAGPGIGLDVTARF